MRKLTIFLLYCITILPSCRTSDNQSSVQEAPGPSDTSLPEIFAVKISPKKNMLIIPPKYIDLFKPANTIYCHRLWTELYARDKDMTDVECALDRKSYLEKWPTSEGAVVGCRTERWFEEYEVECGFSVFNFQGEGEGVVSATFVKYRFNDFGRQQMVVKLEGNHKNPGYFCPLDKEKMNALREGSKFECVLSRGEYLIKWPNTAGYYFKCYRATGYPHQHLGHHFCLRDELLYKD